VPGAEPRRPEALTDAEREVLHRAHQRLRNTSQALEALVATDPIRGRWAPAPAPAEALRAAGTVDLAGMPNASQSIESRLQACSG